VGKDDRFTGYCELPFPIVVTDEVLGTVCPTGIGGESAQIHTPLPQRGSVEFPALAPPLPGAPARHPRTTSPWYWVVHFDNDLTNSGVNCLRRVGVVLHGPASRPSPQADIGPLGSRLGAPIPDGMDHWLADLRSWVEVLAAQSFGDHYPHFDASYLGAGLWISDELANDPRLQQIAPINLSHWQAILERIATSEEPPLGHLLARDARAMFQRGDYRRCAINACAAAEAALHRLSRDNGQIITEAGQGPLPDGKDPGRLVTQLLGAGISMTVNRAEVEMLMAARSLAIQDEKGLDESATRRALETMSRLLGTPGLGPLGPAPRHW
jgi:hypothetical protein